MRNISLTHITLKDTEKGKSYTLDRDGNIVNLSGSLDDALRGAAFLGALLRAGKEKAEKVSSNIEILTIKATNDSRDIYTVSFESGTITKLEITDKNGATMFPDTECITYVGALLAAGEK